jgi:hypothetical protein
MSTLQPILFLLLVALTMANIPSQAFAEDYPPPTFSIPDTDTTPVEFSVGGTSYRVPRNYLTTMDNWKGGPQSLVTLAVNIPDLKPFSEDTSTCFTEKDILRQKGCEPFSFEIKASIPASADDRKLLHGLKPTEGPFGFDKFNAGNGDEYYRKIDDGNTLLYSCQTFDNNGKRDGICEPVGNTAIGGPALHYSFALNHLEDVDQIDASLRNLVDSFMIGAKDDRDDKDD